MMKQVSAVNDLHLKGTRGYLEHAMGYTMHALQVVHPVHEYNVFVLYPPQPPTLAHCFIGIVGVVHQFYSDNKLVGEVLTLVHPAKTAFAKLAQDF
jgi:hypothetical protein